MANASVRMLSMGWTGDQRRALVAALDDRQRAMVRDRIDLERRSGRFEVDDADDALQFLATNGARGFSCGIVEWTAAVLFGGDPVFREAWQAIRRGEMTAETRDDGATGAGSGSTATTVPRGDGAHGRPPPATGEAS